MTKVASISLLLAACATCARASWDTNCWPSWEKDRDATRRVYSTYSSTVERCGAVGLAIPADPTNYLYRDHRAALTNYKRAIFLALTNYVDTAAAGSGTWDVWFSNDTTRAAFPAWTATGILAAARAPTNWFEVTFFRNLSGSGAYTNDLSVGHPHGLTNHYTVRGGTNFPAGRAVWYDTDYGWDKWTNVVTLLRYTQQASSWTNATGYTNYMDVASALWETNFDDAAYTPDLEPRFPYTGTEGPWLTWVSKYDIGLDFGLENVTVSNLYPRNIYRFTRAVTFDQDADYRYDDVPPTTFLQSDGHVLTNRLSRYQRSQVESRSLATGLWTGAPHAVDYYARRVAYTNTSIGWLSGTSTNGGLGGFLADAVPVFTSRHYIVDRVMKLQTFPVAVTNRDVAALANLSFGSYYFDRMCAFKGPDAEFEDGLWVYGGSIDVDDPPGWIHETFYWDQYDHLALPSGTDGQYLEFANYATNPVALINWTFEHQ